MGSIRRSGVLRKSSNDGSARVIIIAILGISVGILIGISLSNVFLVKLDLSPSFPSSIEVAIINGHETGRNVHDLVAAASLVKTKSSQVPGSYDPVFHFLIHVKTNPHGAELLPPGIVVSETDLYLRRLWGDPNEDLKTRPKYLLTFTVGFDQRDNIDAAMEKFSDDFTVLLFHYDGRTSEWDEFEWSKRAIHVSALRQTKWWYAKRFLHPDVVAAYDYIFIWDEDLGVEHFNAEKYLELVNKYGLEISQPGIEVDPDKRVQWNMTKRRGDTEVHKEAADPEWCRDPYSPPCAAFVEIMAPVFSRDAWRCVWHMIQNDLVHGWGLDFALRRCVEPAHEKIGVVDSQWVAHQAIPSLGNQGQAEKGKASREGVKKRCFSEWQQFHNRLADADRAYFQRLGEDS